MKTVIERRIEAFGEAVNNGGAQHLDFKPDNTLLLLVERDAREAIASHKHWVDFYDLYAAALSVTGLNHAVLIGITAGLISFVPYLGAATGLFVSVCVAMAQFWPNSVPVAIVGGIFIVGETLADYVLSPRIIGRRVKLNPVWMMFALFAFGWLFGFIGVLLAIPIAASLGVILRFARQRSLASSGYDVSDRPDSE